MGSSPLQMTAPDHPSSGSSISAASGLSMPCQG
jgi:hypothetical protein